MGATSREKMVRSAAVLMRERGVGGTSFRDVIEHSGAPRGSIYHHFPGGKDQLTHEVITLARNVGASLFANGEDPVASLRAFVRWWRVTLEGSDFRAGCPVVAAATEAADSQAELSEAAGAAFASWQDLLAAQLSAAGVSEARARRLATLTVAASEGAVVLCRAHRSVQPIEDVGAELEGLFVAALEDAR